MSYQRAERYVAWLGGMVVGDLSMSLPMVEHRGDVEVALTVHPGYRRQGIGCALYRHAVTRLRELGRQRITTHVVEPLPGGAPRGRAGGAFLAAMGATPRVSRRSRRPP